MNDIINDKMAKKKCTKCGEVKEIKPEYFHCDDCLTGSCDREKSKGKRA